MILSRTETEADSVGRSREKKRGVGDKMRNGRDYLQGCGAMRALKATRRNRPWNGGVTEWDLKIRKESGFRTGAKPARFGPREARKGKEPVRLSEKKT